jgi:hypothetical protein
MHAMVLKQPGTALDSSAGVRLHLAGDGRRIGMYGFGAAAHILAQVIRWQGGGGVRVHRPG